MMVSKLDSELRQVIDSYLTEDTQNLLGLTPDMRISEILIKMCYHIECSESPCQVSTCIDSLNNS